MKTAIILFSHGSLLCGAGETLRLLAERMQARGDADIVRVGYLNYSEPSFEESFAQCVVAGARKITVAPYFLVAGFFVKQQLPPKISAMQAQFPVVEVLVAEPFRHHELLADALLSCARREQPPGEWRRILKTAPQFCRADASCPLYGGVLCPADSGSGEALAVNENGLEYSASRESSRPETRNPKPETRNPKPETLLVMVHGSPRPESNDDMFRVVEEVKRCAEYSVVEVGFMECNEPDIPTAIENCVRQGAKHLVAVPYFLHTGKHVADDLPTLLEEAQEQYSEVKFTMGDYIGRDALIADVVRERVKAARRV